MDQESIIFVIKQTLFDPKQQGTGVSINVKPKGFVLEDKRPHQQHLLTTLVPLE